MKAMLHLLRTHWRLIVLVLIVLLLLPAVVAALMAAEDAPPAVVPVPAEATGEPAAEPVAPAAGEPAVELPAEPADAPQPFDQYREMIERPLFSSTRRPPVLRDAPQENLDAQQLREAWRLSGIAMHQGRQLASFSEREGERHLLLEQGMVLADEWRLEQIGSDHVLLGNGTNEVYLPLREPVPVAEPDAAADDAAKKKQKKQKNQGKSEKPVQPAAPTDQTTPPADTPAPAKPAQQG